MEWSGRFRSITRHGTNNGSDLVGLPMVSGSFSGTSVHQPLGLA